MRRNIIPLISVLAILLIGSAYFVLSRNNKQGTSTDSITTTPENNVPTPSQVETFDGDLTEAPTAVKTTTADIRQQNQNFILIEGFKYNPDTLTIQKGASITWTNKDVVEHNVEFESNEIPDSELLSKDESYTYTFNQTGTFNYICKPHPYMKAAVVVE